MHKFIKIVLSFAAVTALVACGSAQTKPEAAPVAPAAAPAVAPAAAPAAATAEATCPVSGEKFTPKADSPTSEFNGKTYTFCCGGCKKKFDAEPAKFTGAAPGGPADPKSPSKDDCPCDGK